MTKGACFRITAAVGFSGLATVVLGLLAGCQSVPKGTAPAPLERLRRHYGAVRSCLLVFRIEEVQLANRPRVRETKVYYSAPDSFRYTHSPDGVWDQSVSGLARVMPDATLWPLASDVPLLSQLFAGFKITDRYTMLGAEQERTATGETLDVVSLVRDIAAPKASAGRQGVLGKLRLYLWVDRAGKLRKFRFEETRPPLLRGIPPPGISPLPKVVSSTGLLVREEDNVALPRSFFSSPSSAPRDK